MAEINCEFECNFIDNSGECEAVGTDCIGSLCECWKCCQNCTKSNDCKD